MKGLLQLARTRDDLDRALSIYSRHAVGVHYKKKCGFDIDTWRGCLGRYFFAPGWAFPVEDALKKPAQRFRLTLPDGLKGRGRPLAGLQVALHGAPQLRSEAAWREAVQKMGGQLVSTVAEADLILCGSAPEAAQEADDRARTERHAAEASASQRSAKAPIDPLPYWPGQRGRQRLKRVLPDGQTLWLVRLQPHEEMFWLFVIMTRSDDEQAFKAMQYHWGSARREDPDHGVCWTMTLRPGSPDMHACFEAMQAAQSVAQIDAAAARATTQRHRPLFVAEEMVLDRVVPERIKRTMALVQTSHAVSPQDIAALQRALRGADDAAAAAAMDTVYSIGTARLWEQLIAGTVYKDNTLIPGASLSGITAQRLAALVCRAPDSCPKAVALRSEITSLSMVLTDLSVLSTLTQLKVLSLSTSPLTSLASLPLLPQLTGLGLHRCPALTSLEGIAALPALQRLGASRNPQLADITALAQCTALTEVDLSFSRRLACVDGLGGLSRLAKLNLAHCDVLHEAPGVVGLPALRSLNASPQLTAWLARRP